MFNRRGASVRFAMIGLALVILMVVPTGASTAGSDTHRLVPEDLVYVGAFRLPDDAPDDIGWFYSGHALAYYPEGDPGGPDDGFPGSLFGTGHNWNQYVSEISIPVPVISPDHNPDDLNVAATLQDFQDIRGNMFGELEMPHAGLAYLPPPAGGQTGRLVFSWGQHMQEGETGPSHGWSTLDLADPQVAGPWYVDDLPVYVTNDYLFPIPTAWAAAHTPGRILATGRFREGGQGGCGPSLVAFEPPDADSPPLASSVLPATPLLRYGDFTAPDDHKLNGYQHCDAWSGGAWLTADDRAAVIFVGTKAVGECWYGFANGVVWPEEPPYPPVPPYPYDNRGFWSSSYEAQILFYDPDDLAAVASGDMEPWQPQPYAALNIDEVLFGIESAQTNQRVGAAAFDRARGLLYVIEPLAYGEEGRPLIHVWRVAGN